MSRAAACALAMLPLAAGCSAGPANPLGDPVHGRVVALRQACGSCHTIPGLQQADGLAGPPLTHFARRTVIAGLAPNTPDQLVRWLRAPQSVKPGNAMPDMGLSEVEARDLAAYLGTLR